LHRLKARDEEAEVVVVAGSGIAAGFVRFVLTAGCAARARDYPNPTDPIYT
jgi:hypothetical protein